MARNRRAETSTFEPFGVVIHEPDGASYAINRGEIIGVDYSNIAAYYFSQAGDTIFLEHQQVTAIDASMGNKKATLEAKALSRPIRPGAPR